MDTYINEKIIESMVKGQKDNTEDINFSLYAYINTKITDDLSKNINRMIIE